MANYNSTHTGAEIDSAVDKTSNGTFALATDLTTGLASKQNTLSQTQLNAVNSGITSGKVATYDTLSSTKLDKTGDTMSGPLNMGNNDIRGVQILGVNTVSSKYLRYTDNYSEEHNVETEINAKQNKLYLHTINIQCACSQWQIHFSFISSVATSYSANYNGLYTYLTNKFGTDELYTSGLVVDGSSYNNLTYLVAGDTSANKILHAYFISDNHTLTQVYANTSATSVTDIVVSL